MVKIENYHIEPELFDKPLFGLHLRLMRLYGYIIGTNQRNWLWHFIRSSFFTFSFIVFAILNFIQVMRGIHVLLADRMLRMTMVLEVCTAIHAVNAYFQRARVVRLVNFVHTDLLVMRFYTDSLEDEIFNKTVKYLRRLTYMFYIPNICNGFLMTLQCWMLTILYPEMIYYKVLSPQMWNDTAPAIILLESFPFGEVLGSFVLGYLGSCYAVVMTVLVVPIFYVFYSVLIKFAILKLEINSKRFSEMNLAIFKPSLRSIQENKYPQETELNILRLKMCKNCVEDLIKLRWFIKELEKLQSIPLFMDSLIISILLCVVLYVLSTGGLSPVGYWYSFVFMVVGGGLQLIHHWHATVLTNTHEAMGFAIYSCDWYNYPLKVQKTIRLTMMDISRPLVMSALFVDLKLATVVDIFRGAYGYYSVLTRTNNLKNQ